MTTEGPVDEGHEGEPTPAELAEQDSDLTGIPEEGQDPAEAFPPGDANAQHEDTDDSEGRQKEGDARGLSEARDEAGEEG
jgi:hypothetical protein